MTEERREEFTTLYRRARPRILSYALRRTNSSEDAIDVVAETFAIAWRRFEDVPSGDAAVLWLYVTARNVLANEGRRARRRTELVALLADEIESAASCAVAHEDDGFVALQCLRALPEPDREVLMLAGWDGLSAAAIGQVLGCSPTAARIRLHRARRRLVEAVEATERAEREASKRRAFLGHARRGSAVVHGAPEEV